MAYSLEQVDLVRERMGVGYGEAKEALAESEGDVLAALAAIEKRQTNVAASTRIEGIINSIAEEVKQSLTGRLITGVRIKLGDQTVREVPVALVGVGAVLLTLVSSILAYLKLETVFGDAAETDHSETE